MKKNISVIKEIALVAVLILALFLIFVPMPASLINKLLLVNIGFSLFLFVTRFLGNTRLTFLFPKLVQYFCFFTCGLAISTTRIFLTVPTIEENVPVVVAVSRWICRENYVSGFLTTLMVFVVLVIYCKWYVNRNLETAARFSLEGLPRELSEIERKLIIREISEDEAAKLKKEVQKKSSFFGEMDGSAKFLFGTISVIMSLFLVAAGGGITMGILHLGLGWKEVLEQYVMLSSGYLVLFIVPLLLTSLGFKICNEES